MRACTPPSEAHVCATWDGFQFRNASLACHTQIGIEEKIKLLGFLSVRPMKAVGASDELYYLAGPSWGGVMRRRNVLGLLGAGASALALSGCLTKTIKFRWRLTVEVLTPDGLKSGSSVLETQFSDSTRMPWGRFTSRFIGEAAEVVLPGKGSLFALLQDDRDGRTAAEYPILAFYDQLPVTPDRWEDYRYLVRLKGQRAVIVPKLPVFGVESVGIQSYPKLVFLKTHPTRIQSKWSTQAQWGRHWVPGINCSRLQ